MHPSHVAPSAEQWLTLHTLQICSGWGFLLEALLDTSRQIGCPCYAFHPVLLQSQHPELNIASLCSSLGKPSVTDHSGHQHVLAYWVTACLPWNVNSSKNMDSRTLFFSTMSPDLRAHGGSAGTYCLFYFHVADAINDHKLCSQNNRNL